MLYSIYFISYIPLILMLDQYSTVQYYRSLEMIMILVCIRYRALDAWKRCTSIAIRETRKKELQQELLNSTKLKSFFEDNPRDLQVLRHDKSKHGLTPMTHLKHVPEYNIPDNLRRVSRISKKIKGNKNAPKVKLDKNQKKRATKTQLKYKIKKADPLQSMEFSGFKKQKT
ncbi:ATP-dependent RNA helicase DBP9-like [Homarus americanus]|uniref:ATP-dependent RNA helicase DBP9-like n=1 Tax=Homarus americanus TaxID=6706 RepID=A0A8J5JXZ6_HOMAM|nr:ATP-dependent RNA helicase DBP9-like [Homarus americanus]